MFTFGIGTSVNRHIIEGMARVGMGEPFVITRLDEAPARAERFRTLIQSPMLTKVKVKFQDFSTYDIEPPSIPDVLAERPVIIFGKWRGQPRGKITLNGISGNGPYREVIDVGAVKPMESNSALRYLWARHRIALLSDYNKLRSNDKRVKEVTDLGLTYNLLTAYTSFVAVDTEVRNQSGQVSTVKQPLPLPQGVSDYAVGEMKLSQAYAPLMARKEDPAGFEARTLRDQASSGEVKRTVALGDIDVSEGLSKEAVLNMIQKKTLELGKSSLEREPGGKLVFQLIINPDGQVKNVKIVSSSLKNSRFQKGIIEQVKKWQFPSTRDGREAKVTIALVIGS
jgi:Ca-activated chloride channel family protein